jgi:hypothetical protein
MKPSKPSPKTRRPRWGWSRKPVPRAVRARLAAKQALSAPTTALLTPPTGKRTRSVRSPAPSPTTAWLLPDDSKLAPEWAALAAEAGRSYSRQLWPEACTDGAVRGIDTAASAARTRAAKHRAMPTPPATSPDSPTYQPTSAYPASHSPVYQPASHPPPAASPARAPTISITAPSTYVEPPSTYVEPPSPVPGITRQRPAWTRPGGPLPPFLAANEVPPDFEEHRWNMAYVVHEVAGLEWHEECTCMDCDETALPRARRMPKLWPGREVVNPFLVAYFNGE